MGLLRASMKGQRCPRPVAHFAEAGVVKWPGTYEVLESGKPGRQVSWITDLAAEGNGYWVYEA